MESPVVLPFFLFSWVEWYFPSPPTSLPQSQEGTFEEVHLWRTEATGAGPCLEDRQMGLPEPLSEESQVMGVRQPVIPSEGAAKLREPPLGPDSAEGDGA